MRQRQPSRRIVRTHSSNQRFLEPAIASNSQPALGALCSHRDDDTTETVQERPILPSRKTQDLVSVTTRLTNHPRNLLLLVRFAIALYVRHSAVAVIGHAARLSLMAEDSVLLAPCVGRSPCEAASQPIGTAIRMIAAGSGASHVSPSAGSCFLLPCGS